MRAKGLKTERGKGNSEGKGGLKTERGKGNTEGKEGGNGKRKGEK